MWDSRPNSLVPGPVLFTTLGKNLCSWRHRWDAKSTSPKPVPPWDFRFKRYRTAPYYRSQFGTAFPLFAGESIVADAMRKNIPKVKTRKERWAIGFLDQLPFVLAQELSFFRHFKSPQVLPFKRDYEVNPILESLALLAICNISLMRNYAH